MVEADKHSIVVVEDEAVVLMLYKIKFSEWDLPLNLVTAMNGFDGLLKIGRCKPLLVISDLNMPGMDGLQMINTLKEDNELVHTKFIVVTSRDAIEVQQTAGFPEDVAVLPKPVPFELLESLIRAKLESVAI